MEENQYIVRIINTEYVTHNVRRFRCEKPENYQFVAGQATEVSINTSGYRDKKGPFTFTALNSDPYLEFTIKIYEDHDGLTRKLGGLEKGDELIVRDVWGAIKYTGPGDFIAGGAGVTPFIAIFRQLHKDNRIQGNRLIFSNKTEADIILKDEFATMLGENFINTLTKEKKSPYDNRRIGKSYLKEIIHDFSRHFYVCGPDSFVGDIQEALMALGATAEAVVIEE